MTQGRRRGWKVTQRMSRAPSNREDVLSSLLGTALGHRAEAGGPGARGGAAVGGCCAGKANSYCWQHGLVVLPADP